MFTMRRSIAALLLLGAGLAPAYAQTNRYAAADSPDSPDNSAHALDALSSAAVKTPAAPAGEAASRGQLAAVQARLESFMRQSTAATDDNRAALADIHARLDALQQQLNRQQQARGGDDPRIEALSQRLEQDERLIAQLRGQQAAVSAPAPVAAARPAVAAPVAAAAPAAPAVNCNELSDGSNDAAWNAAVARAFPGYTVDSLDLNDGRVSVRKGDARPEAITTDSVLRAVGCS
jgi:hypothetical protein